MRGVMPPALALVLACLLSACLPAPAPASYAEAAQAYRLAAIDGRAFTADATIRFPTPGQIAGAGPCNGFSGLLPAAYPAFATAALAVTRRSCAAQAQETAFLQALGRMTAAEFTPGGLRLSGPSGRSMTFQAE